MIAGYYGIPLLNMKRKSASSVDFHLIERWSESESSTLRKLLYNNQNVFMTALLLRDSICEYDKKISGFVC